MLGRILRRASLPSAQIRLCSKLYSMVFSSQIGFMHGPKYRQVGGDPPIARPMPPPFCSEISRLTSFRQLPEP